MSGVTDQMQYYGWQCVDALIVVYFNTIFMYLVIRSLCLLCADKGFCLPIDAYSSVSKL